MNLNYIFTCLCILFFPFIIEAENAREIDSLNQKLKVSSSYQEQVDIMNTLSGLYVSNQINIALEHAQNAMLLAQKINYKKGMGDAYYSLSDVYGYKYEFLKALENLNQCLKIRQEIKDLKGSAKVLETMGAVLEELNDLSNAIPKFIESQQLYEKINDEEGIANCNIYLGVIYKARRNFELAHKYFSNTLVIRMKLGDKAGVGNCYINLGDIYIQQKNYNKAIEQFKLALEYRLQSGSKNGIGNAYNWLGNAYTYNGNYEMALNEYDKTITIRNEIDDKFGLGKVYIDLGELYERKKDFEKALKNYKLSIYYFDKINEIKESVKCKLALADIYINLKQFKIAFDQIDEALVASKGLSDFQLMEKCYYARYLVDIGRGDIEMALKDYSIRQKYIDSADVIQKERLVTEQLITYEYQKMAIAEKLAQEKRETEQKWIRMVLFIGLLSALVVSFVFFKQRNRIFKEMQISELERNRSDSLLLNILPEEVAIELKSKGSADAKQFEEVTVLFTDFKNFTQISEKMTPKELVKEIDICFKAFDTIIEKYGIEKIKTIGDSYMCAGGLPVANKTHASDVVNAGLEIQHFIFNRMAERTAIEKEPFQIRIGIHTGPVVAGIVGLKKFAYDIWGDTVNTASRMENSGEVGKVNISGTTYEQVKGQFDCIYRGKIHAKGMGEIDMYFVEGKI